MTKQRKVAITTAPQRILVVRLGAMGDVIHALPAVAALRQSRPEARIGWVIEERWAELLGPIEGPRSPARPLVDDIHTVNTRAWRLEPFSDETWKELTASIRSLRNGQYEAAIDFQGTWKSAVMARLSGAPVRVGFRQPRESGARIFNNRTVEASGVHVIEQNVSLLAGLGVRHTDCVPAAVLPRNEAHERWAEEELSRRGQQAQRFAVINPGAGWGAKRWPAERYGEVARALAESGIQSLVNFGPGEEELADAVVAAGGGGAQAFRSTVGELVALLRRARVFVGGDTGPMHLAAALRVPVVAIFGPTDPARNGPYGTRATVLRSPESVTDHSRHRQPEAAMLSITAADVVAAARQLLSEVSGG